MNQNTKTFVRRVICWAGIIFMLITLIPAWGYDVPPEVEVSGTFWDGDFEFTGKDDFSEVPWWVRMWKEGGWPILSIIATGLLLWGALKKERQPHQIKYPYLGNIKTAIYHLRQCHHALIIDPENTVWFESVDQAIANGFRPCSTCNPRPSRRSL